MRNILVIPRENCRSDLFTTKVNSTRQSDAHTIDHTYLPTYLHTHIHTHARTRLHNSRIRQRSSFTSLPSLIVVEKCSMACVLYACIYRLVTGEAGDKAVEVKTGQRVTLVTFNITSEQATVLTSGNQTYTADKVLIAVPLGLLRDDVITFTPALETKKQNAIDKLGTGRRTVRVHAKNASR